MKLIKGKEYVIFTEGDVLRGTYEGEHENCYIFMVDGRARSLTLKEGDDVEDYCLPLFDSLCHNGAD